MLVQIMAILPRPADAMIVLGRADERGYINADARERIRYAASLYKQGLVPVAIAPARWSYRLEVPPTITEAAAIKAGLVAHGVPAEAVYTEEKSCDTLGAAYFFKIDFVLPRGWRRLLVVTSTDHYARTRYVFHKVFGEAYDLQYVCGRQVLDEAEFAASMGRESKSLCLMDRTWVGPVVPGNHQQIEEIFKLHPGYSSAATLSRAEMEARIQAQVV